jgi:adenylate cyclase
MNLSRPAMRRIAGCVGGALLATGLGCALFHLPFGQRLSELSYDLPFTTRGNLTTPEIVIIFIDKPSQAKYSTDSGRIDRRAHVELLQRLTRDGARMVFYDIVFESELPEVDPEFAKVIREHGNVVLGYIEIVSVRDTQVSRGFATELLRPNPTLRQAARHYGLLMTSPDSDRAVRRLFTGDAEREAAVWATAGAMAKGNRSDERWLNYYGYPPAFPSVSFAAALTPDGVPADFFRNKIVLIGAHTEISDREKFGTPWNRYTFAAGVEVLATSLGNLIQGNWLRRISPAVQLPVILALGVVFGIGLSLLRPWTAAAAALGAVVLITVVSIYVQYQNNSWWSWMIPVAAQAPAALVWSIAYQYAVASRREAEMKKAFSSYLSPHLVKRIAVSDFDLKLGGKEVEATILFTDLEGFTTLAESLPPNEVSQILTGYFERITRHILQQEGTIIKYIGDAVMAVWGAPLPDARQAERAVLAALGMIRESQQSFSGRRLRTRIGINSGKALAGNLGSSFRFDYTVIGATTNLANRLEGLNKVLGTDILIADSTRQRLPKEIVTRDLGPFIVRGTTEPIRVHEVLDLNAESDWLRRFNEALEEWRRGQTTTAASLLQKVIGLRGGRDGPSEFYLNLIQSAAIKSGDPIKIEVK